MPDNFQVTDEEPSDREDNEDEDESNSVNVSPSVHAASELVPVRSRSPTLNPPGDQLLYCRPWVGATTGYLWRS